jgi:hypothetical protein
MVLGGTNDSLEVVMANEDPNAHMSIRISGGEYFRADVILEALDDLHMKALLDAFTASDKVLASIFKQSRVLEAYADLRNS